MYECMSVIILLTVLNGLRKDRVVIEGWLLWRFAGIKDNNCGTKTSAFDLSRSNSEIRRSAWFQICKIVPVTPMLWPHLTGNCIQIQMSTKNLFSPRKVELVTLASAIQSITQS